MITNFSPRDIGRMIHIVLDPTSKVLGYRPGYKHDSLALSDLML